jgi:hypothetical protein
MASKNAQTHAKRARELALRERRDRKREKKAEAAARRTADAAVEEDPAARPEAERPTVFDDQALDGGDA